MDGNTSITNDRIPLNPSRLAEYLENQIISGEVREGEKLPSERGLSKRFGVSRPVVREALQSLVGRNLVHVIPGRGAYVRRARLTDAARPMDLLLRRWQATPRDLVEARKMIECKAAFLAASRAEREDLEAMEQALVGFDRSSDLLEKTRYDITFHTSIVRAARNPVIETMFSSITNLIVELMLRSLSDPNVSRVGIPYHREIYEATRDGDAEQARTAMDGHLLVAERLYGEDYDRSLGMLARRELTRLLGPDAMTEDLLVATIPTIGEDQAVNADGGRGNRSS
jgi:GntR family transcriptional repressor for pyruvate dehydrogenase complex